MPRPPRAKKTTAVPVAKSNASRPATNARGKRQSQNEEVEEGRPAKRSRQTETSTTVNDAPEKRGKATSSKAARDSRGGPRKGLEQTRESQEVDELDQEQEEPQQKSRKRMRPSLGQVEDEESVPKRSRGRPSLAEVVVSKAQNNAPAKTTQKKPGRASLPKNESQAQPRRGGRASLGVPITQSPARRRSSQGNDVSGTPSKPNASLLRQIPHVVPKERHLPISAIHSKWRPLEPPARDVASEILRLASVPVLQTCPAGTKRDLYSRVIDVVIRQVAKQQSKKLPFPIASNSAQATARRSKNSQNDGRERELDRQRVEHDVREAEGKLTPLVHSVNILKAEVKRMESVLEMELEQVNGLERNVKESKSVWGEGLKKAHKLVPGHGWMADEDSGEGLELDSSEGGDTKPLFKDLPDGELAALTKQASSHIESMKTNVEQVTDLLPLINESQALLRTALYKNLPTGLYEEAVMGEKQPVTLNR